MITPSIGSGTVPPCAKRQYLLRQQHGCFYLQRGGCIAKTFTWGLDLSGSLQGAGRVGGLLAEKYSASDYAYTSDANGNVSEVLNASGVVTAHYEYDPFGSPTTLQDSAYTYDCWIVSGFVFLETTVRQFVDLLTGETENAPLINEIICFNVCCFCLVPYFHHHVRLIHLDYLKKSSLQRILLARLKPTLKGGRGSLQQALKTLPLSLP